jgi:hypothetical protein
MKAIILARDFMFSFGEMSGQNSNITEVAREHQQPEFQNHSPGKF